jgi:Holliday junction resolvasome RuvABC endonuclease subunit
VITIEHVVGIDLSLTSTGIAVKTLNLAGGYTITIPSTGHRGDTWHTRHKRINTIVGHILTHIPVGPALIALEAPAYSSNTGSVWDRAGAWWRIYDLLADEHTVVPVLPNLRAKYATGKANASKDAVLAAAVRRYPDWDITNNNTADALILAAIGARLAGEPFDDLPLTHLDALKTLELPHV